MKISITKEAKYFIDEKGKNAFITIGNISGCCGGNIPIPDIYLGLPEDRDGYIVNTIDDINIFVKKDINLDKGINVTIAKLLWYKRLYLELV